ncbi:MAG: hypothetical protein PT965_03485 [Clostridia bacterium]|nr:hypothetical protein [Clostridia bacterium]MDY2929145.1 hypothetical protein [Clostridiaceae bacterium]
MQVFSHKLIRFTLVLGAVLTVLMAALGSCLLLAPLAALREVLAALVLASVILFSLIRAIF